MSLTPTHPARHVRAALCPARVRSSRCHSETVLSPTEPGRDRFRAHVRPHPRRPSGGCRHDRGRCSPRSRTRARGRLGRPPLARGPLRGVHRARTRRRARFCLGDDEHGPRRLLEDPPAPHRVAIASLNCRAQGGPRRRGCVRADDGRIRDVNPLRFPRPHRRLVPFSRPPRILRSRVSPPRVRSSPPTWRMFLSPSWPRGLFLAH